MPLGAAPLSASEVSCISTWIGALPPGAVDAGGDAPSGNACEPGLTSCAPTCVDTRTDPNNCGACGNACSGAAPLCFGGACTATCPAPTTNCSNACVDTSSSATHCGSCGNACSTGKVCGSGACTCGAGPATLSAIQTQSLTPACATSNCHAPTTVGQRTIPAQAGLDLRAGSSFGNLVGVASSACRSRTRVVAGNVGASYFMNKLTGVDMCTGSQMPKRGVSLPAAQLDMIRAWICNGAAND
jgi:hypothetical protein